MWIDFLKPFENGFPIIPHHVVLLHGNVSDWHFHGFDWGEQMIDQYLICSTSRFFDNIYTVDLISPLEQVYGNTKKCDKIKNKSELIPDEPIDNNLGSCQTDGGLNIVEKLERIKEIMISAGSKNLILFDYIEKVFPAEEQSEFDRVYMLHLMKWLHNQNIRKSRNLLIMICRNWNQLSGEIKQLEIQKVEVPLPDRETYESYLRYLVAYAQEVEYEAPNDK